MDKPKEGKDIGDILHYLRFFIQESNWAQDFIFATGHFRIEYHQVHGTFVIEQRLFDRVEVKPDQPELADELPFGDPADPTRSAVDQYISKNPHVKRVGV